MNIFVLSTGRCGSVTFSRACAHITSYSTAHESNADLIGARRLEFPEDHIEVDNRLAWYLGRLDSRFGDDAIYVNLVREKEQVARSYARRKSFGIMSGFHNGILINAGDLEPLDIANDMIDTVQANIRHFLRGKSRTMECRLENIQTDFGKFWELIGAEGDLEAALNTFTRDHNTSAEMFDAPRPSISSRLLRKTWRIMEGLPTYLRDA